MINRNFDDIEMDDLVGLKTNAVAESRTIEYKKALPGKTDGARKEFLADISSFANTSGGDLIFGIDAKGGIPTNIDGVKFDNADEEILKYENIIRDGIEPRIIVNIRVVEMPEDKRGVIFRVAKSWTGPHRVIFKGHDKFYARHSAGKYPLETSELRTAFNLSQTLNDQINRFHIDRISQITANETPLPFIDGAKIVLHLIPFESVTPGFGIDISPVSSRSLNLKTIYRSGAHQRINLDGVLAYGKYSEDQAYSYAQLYRNGIIEAVDGAILRESNEKKIIPSVSLERALMRSLKEYLELAMHLDISTPMILYLTLLGVKGYEMAVRNRELLIHDEISTIDRDILSITSQVIESYDTTSQKILRPTFDLIWNACGFERSLNFDTEGNWISK